MKKKLVSALMISTMILGLAACTGAGQQATVEDKKEETTTEQEAGDDKKEETAAETPAGKVLKLAFNQSENHPQYKALAEFGEKLKEETGGAYEIEIHPNELLGSQKDAFELVQGGTVEMAMVANSIVENVNGDFAVLGVPYVYDNIEHQKEVFTSGILQPLFDEVTEADNGFSVLTAFTAGSRNVYTDKPIKTPDDLKGYKVRVMESPTNIAMMKYMGGVGTPMAQGEVYTAIQQGTINGGENNEVTYNDLKHYEVAPYFSYTNHLMIPDLLVINTKVYEEIPADVKEIFDRLVEETTKREFELWDEAVGTAKKAAQDNGATFVEDADVAAFQDACKPLHDEVTSKSENAKKIYDEIRGLAK